MEFFHIQWPRHTAWGLRLVGRLNNSTNDTLRNLAKRNWPAEQMIAFATKLALIRVVQHRFNEDVKRLSDEFEKKTAEIQRCLPQHKALTLTDQELAFRLVAGIDAFIFEARSAYEILGTVVSRIASEILGIKADEKALRKALEAKGQDTRWVDDLHDARIWFFHSSAPWIGVEVTDTKPPYEIRVLRRNAYDLEQDINASFPLAMLNEIFFGFDRAAKAIQEWLLEAIDRVEKGATPF